MSATGDTIRSILAGIGAGTATLGESMSDREKAALAVKRLMLQQQAQDDREPPHVIYDYSNPQGPVPYQYNPRTKSWDSLNVSGPRASVVAPNAPPVTPDVTGFTRPGDATRALSALVNGGGAPTVPPVPVRVPPQGIPTAPSKTVVGKPVAMPSVDKTLVRVVKDGKTVYAPRSEAVGQEAPATVPPDQLTPVDNPDQPGTRKLAIKKPGLVVPGPDESGDTRTGTQVSTAANQALSAHQQMIELEKDFAAHPIGTVESTLAMRAFGGGLDSKGAEEILNRKYPKVARYVRAAKTIGVAERLIMPRGGSNYLTSSEIALAGAGPGADADQIAQAQAYRQALVDGLLSHVPKTDGGNPKPTASVKKDAVMDKYGLTPP